jgi:hypothetical protein
MTTKKSPQSADKKLLQGSDVYLQKGKNTRLKKPAPVDTIVSTKAG